MALGTPLPGGSITQRFGPSSMAVQPSMYHTGTTKAWWQPYPGGVFNLNCHAGVDFAGKAAGAPLVAVEAGIVTQARYDGVNGGGHTVEVEIRHGVRYSYNHCQRLYVGQGAKVKRGQVIAAVGATGTIRQPNGSLVRSAYGVHCHTNLLILESNRWMLYDFQDFMPGGASANDGRVKPVAAPSTYPIATINSGVNIRSTADLDVGGANILYVTRDDGVYNLRGQKVANRGGWQKRGTKATDDGTWGVLYGLNRYVFVMNGLYR